MLALGVTAIWLGGFVWVLVLSVVVGGMFWELARMSDPKAPSHPMVMGALAMNALMAATHMQAPIVYAALGIAGLFGVVVFYRKWRFLAYGVMIALAGFALVQIREDAGLGWMIWLALIVVTTDVAGYFAGRTFGGPKFWPRISPKKTWSGTIAGWIGAALVGAVFVAQGHGGSWLIALSVAVSFASQLGDIAESALKRRAGVKDSSNLIPGHGGLLDRFDGMLGAAAFVFLVGALFGLPAGMP
jgi:phosphatidate cytidylyltransferase